MEMNHAPGLQTVKLKTGLCIVGGGMAGFCAALAAARRGVQTVLVHDRPVPGGNASSEIRMWVRGAHGENCRETGIIEEVLLEHAYSNPKSNMSIWDSILYGKLQYQQNLTLLLNTSCLDAVTENDRIVSIKAWQSISQTFYEVEAGYFADCSGDSILGAVTPALHRYGRESKAEFNEPFGPETADRFTMGNSCLLQVRECDKPVKYIPPVWAEKYRKPEDLPLYRDYTQNRYQNFWYIEIGGTGNTILDTDKNRERLLRIVFGLWDYLKNYAPDKEVWANWELDWAGFLPGKRESRRLVGDYIMTANDIVAGGRFHDTIAYGGWTMDDHPPLGFDDPGVPTKHYPAPSPFGIPYRCLYSVNISNLFFAGRNISVSHGALSATRVMATCATLGEAMGTAAAIAVNNGISPREVGEKYLTELQQDLLEHDCFLPGIKRVVSDITAKAVLASSNGIDPEPLRDGADRPDQEKEHCWQGKAGDSVTFEWQEAVSFERIRMIFDSDINRDDYSTVALRCRDYQDIHTPETLVTAYKLEFKDSSGKWQLLHLEQNNFQRLAFVRKNITAAAIRFTLLKGGNDSLKVFSLDVK